MLGPLTRSLPAHLDVNAGQEEVERALDGLGRRSGRRAADRDDGRVVLEMPVDVSP